MVKNEPISKAQEAKPDVLPQTVLDYVTEKDYVIHKVQKSDTLDKISLIYDIRKDLIKRAN